MPKSPRNRIPQPPASSEEGAALIRAAVVKLYDRVDGERVAWKAVTEALFRAALDALDKLPDGRKAHP